MIVATVLAAMLGTAVPPVAARSASPTVTPRAAACHVRAVTCQLERELQDRRSKKKPAGRRAQFGAVRRRSSFAAGGFAYGAGGQPVSSVSKLLAKMMSELATTLMLAFPVAVASFSDAAEMSRLVPSV